MARLAAVLRTVLPTFFALCFFSFHPCCSKASADDTKTSTKPESTPTSAAKNEAAVPGGLNPAGPVVSVPTAGVSTSAPNSTPPASVNSAPSNTTPSPSPYYMYQPPPKVELTKKIAPPPSSASLQALLSQKSRATCDAMQDHLRDLDNKTLENIGSIDNLNLNDKIGVENSRRKFGDSIEIRRRAVLQVDTCERLHSQILNYYNNQDPSSFLQERISNMLISDMGIGRLKSPESDAVLAFLFDLKIELKSSSLTGVSVWEFVAERLREFTFGPITTQMTNNNGNEKENDEEDRVTRVLESAYSDDVKGQRAADVSLEEAGDFVEAKMSERGPLDGSSFNRTNSNGAGPNGTSRMFRSDSHDQLELRP